MQKKNFFKKQRPEAINHTKDINVSLLGKVENLSYSSAGVLRHESKVVFIPYTVTGDVVSFSIEKNKKTFSEGKLIEVLNSSPYRRKPQCPYFGRCGGCQWQHITYEYQIKAKSDITKDLTSRIGKIENANVLNTYCSDYEWYYRQRVRFQVGFDKGVCNFGFAVFNSNEVVDIETCYILKKPIVNLIKKIRNYKDELKNFYDFEVYYSEYEDEFIFNGLTRDITGFNNVRRFPELFKGGVLVDKRTKRNVSIKNPYLNFRVDALGESFIQKVYAGGFIQANPSVNKKILNYLSEELKDTKKMRLLELYAGSGNFTIPLSRLFKQVVAVESSPASFRALEENVYKSSAINVMIIKADVRDEVVKSFNLKKKYDAVFIDPPRIGAKEIISYLPQLNPELIIYLSCNPATLARDLQPLIYSNYIIEKIIPFDMFPQTFHIEALAILKKVQ